MRFVFSDKKMNGYFCIVLYLYKLKLEQVVFLEQCKVWFNSTCHKMIV